MIIESGKMRALAICVAISLLGMIIFSAAPTVMAQAPTPSPAHVSDNTLSNSDALTSLVIVAGNMIPRIQQAVESPLVKGLENLAFWIAVIVMLFSFARLFRENDGATKDLFWWCFRLAIIFSLFGSGQTIIDTWRQIGYDIINVTEFRKVLWDAEIEFNTNYEKFTEGMFLVKSTNTEEAIAALTTDHINLRNITGVANPSAWSLPNIFFGVTIARAILQFSQIYLVLLGALITMALRLFAPFAIALAIDRNLAQRISYPFTWSAGVFTMVTPLVSHIIGFIVYQVGNMALGIIKPESPIFSMGVDGSITGDPKVVGPATAACVILILLMIVSSLLLLASPYISYKLAFGQLFEAVSATASGWLGALTATGIEIAGITFGSALQRQASETRIEGQAQAEIERAKAARGASDFQAAAQQLLGMNSAAANRFQSLKAIEGSYAMAKKINEAQRDATTGLIEQSRLQQVQGILADRGFGQRQVGTQVGREERDLRISQAYQNTSTAIHRVLENTDNLGRGISRLGGESAPLLPALGDATRIVTGSAGSLMDISLNNTNTAARISSVRIAGQSQVENYEFTARMREIAADNYAGKATIIANQQASANTAAALVNQNTSAGGVEGAYAKQIQGITKAYQLNLDANQLNLSGALKAAEILKSSGMKAVKLDQMSQIVSTLSRDLGRRAESGMSLRY